MNSLKTSMEILLEIYDQQEIHGKPVAEIIAHKFAICENQLSDCLNYLQNDLLYINRSGRNTHLLPNPGKMQRRRVSDITSSLRVQGL